MAASSAADDEFILQVPSGLLVERNGFSLDIGGSCAKLVYYDKSDTDNPPEMVNLHLVIFVRDETTSVCERLQKKFNLPGNPEWSDRQVHTTGIGGNEFLDVFQDKLGVRIKNLTEMDCFVKAFTALAKVLPQERFCLEKDQESVDAANENLAQLKEMIKKMVESGSMDMKIPGYGEERNGNSPVEGDGTVNMFPCGVCMVGSGGAIMKFNEDGSSEMVEPLMRCGRMFLGLGALLTGGEGYAGIMDAAEKGSFRKVCTMATDFNIQKGNDGDDMYTSISEMAKMELPAFLYGKAVNKTINDFTKEDLAMTLVLNTAMDIVQVVQMAASESGLKRIFFVGNFFNHPLMRKQITFWFLSLRSAVKPDVLEMQFDFVRHGGHLGAIGALMTGNLNEQIIPGSKDA